MLEMKMPPASGMARGAGEERHSHYNPPASKVITTMGAKQYPSFNLLTDHLLRELRDIKKLAAASPGGRR
jgi:hypothetical protein